MGHKPKMVSINKSGYDGLICSPLNHETMGLHMSWPRTRQCRALVTEVAFVQAVVCS